MGKNYPALAYSVIAPVSYNLTIVAIAIGAPRALTGDPVTAVGFAAASVPAAVAAFFSYFNQATSNRLALVVILGTGALSVLYFALMFHEFGLEFTGPDRLARAHGEVFADALYFSVVTFTTLGYGDFQPAVSARLLAAIEALLGYVYLGLMVATVHHWATDARTGAGSGEKTADFDLPGIGAIGIVSKSAQELLRLIWEELLWTPRSQGSGSSRKKSEKTDH